MQMQCSIVDWNNMSASYFISYLVQSVFKILIIYFGTGISQNKAFISKTFAKVQKQIFGLSALGNLFLLFVLLFEMPERLYLILNIFPWFMKRELIKSM